MINNRILCTTFLGASAMTLSALAAAATTSEDASRYLMTSQQTVAVSGYGTCVRTGSWTPDTSLPVLGCDDSPRRVATAPAPAPEPEPAPAAAAPAEPVTPPPAVAEAQPEPAPAPMPEKISLSTDALFNFDKAELRPDAKAELDGLLARLRAANIEEISAVGHTDSIGPDEYNLKLSERRAEAVKSYLVSQGMPEDKIHVEGKGKREPIADNKSKQGRQENRRVDIEVVGTSTEATTVGASASRTPG